MVLKRLKLKNFRGYKDFQVNFDDSINVIIGRNDIGKSTILEALEIFFNSEKIKMDPSDLCVYAGESAKPGCYRPLPLLRDYMEEFISLNEPGRKSGLKVYFLIWFG